MDKGRVHAVTGAYGYSGKYIAQRLLDEGRAVITLTNSPGRANSFGERVRALPEESTKFEIRNPKRALMTEIQNSKRIGHPGQA